MSKRIRRGIGHNVRKADDWQYKYYGKKKTYTKEEIAEYERKAKELKSNSTHQRTIGKDNV